MRFVRSQPVPKLLSLKTGRSPSSRQHFDGQPVATYSSGGTRHALDAVEQHAGFHGWLKPGPISMTSPGSDELVTQYSGLKPTAESACSECRGRHDRRAPLTLSITIGIYQIARSRSRRMKGHSRSGGTGVSSMIWPIHGLFTVGSPSVATYFDF